MRKTIRAVAVTTLAALGTVGLLSTPAAADDGPSPRGSDEKINVYTYTFGEPDYAGYVEFKHADDKFYLYRQKSAGNRIYLEYARKGSPSFSTLVGPYEEGATDVHDLNLTEGKVYKFRGCIQLDYEEDDCSGYQHFTA
ncbi:hypothetical protein [Stackebrandtia nassauensis]|uniref:Uncharacterized protein n=1 Tax=Stackebrandtia nassauensis (strain DSM 44728 / CIP 108903 / NRRL B-16338 / NBRC 102104 / LLR-40K-21) TaxID=446470 RepID=D3QAW4_STANL|nr:hypothetical protein [Stackebrandtia nassauensis]ADD44760.1 hypothetical protein Snas_5125 [Stackebrandtia nassauensis DSM 44728]